MDIEKAKATQLANIEKRSGKSLAEFSSLVAASKLSKHGEILAMLKERVGLGHGDANAIAKHVKSLSEPMISEVNSTQTAIEALFSGPKEALRPIFDALMAKLTKLGEFEIAPKKGYLSLRRAKQFASITPATKSRLDLGIIVKDAEATDRFIAQPAMAMFPFKVGLTSIENVDSELMNWLKKAYKSAE